MQKSKTEFDSRKKEENQRIKSNNGQYEVGHIYLVTFYFKYMFQNFLKKKLNFFKYDFCMKYI